MPLFEYITRNINGRDWRVAKALIDVNSDFVQHCRRATTEKMQHLMGAGQDGANRDQQTRWENLLKEWLQASGLINWEVVLYDDVRTDGYIIPDKSYDLKIQKNKDEADNYLLEVRSSVTYARDLDSSLRDLDIIGPYTSPAKANEDYVDFYIRPLYDNLQPMPAIQFSQFLANGRVVLYFVGGCLREQMENRGIRKNMSQGTTLYRCVPIMAAGDIVTFRDEFLAVFRNRDAARI
jgi:hypothetical protein